MKLPEPRPLGRKLQPKSGSRFVIREPKPVEEETARRFWQDYDSGKRVRKFLTNPITRARKVFAFSRTLLGTVREFLKSEDLEGYLRLAQAVPREIMANSPKTFELKLVEVLSIDSERNRLVERVYAAPSVKDWLMQDREARYNRNFENRMKKNGIGFEEAKETVQRAYRELGDITSKLMVSGINFDFAKSNILLLDIDKETRKVLFAIVDFGGSKREHPRW